MILNFFVFLIFFLFQNILCKNNYYNAFEQTIVFLDTNISSKFILKYNEICSWKVYCKQFEIKNNISNSEVCQVVLNHLIKYKFSEFIINGSSTLCNQSILIPRSYNYVHTLLHSNINDNTTSQLDIDDYFSDSFEKTLIYPKIGELLISSNPQIDIQLLLHHQKYYQNPSQLTSLRYKSSFIPSYLLQNQKILLYQSLGVYTGGTIAIELIHQQLLKLGFQSILCNDQNINNIKCQHPTGDEIVITGEWCHGVLESHGIGPSSFRGRGIQYHLGFHHYDDICRGHITLTNSHYLSTLLAERILGGYFLGCEMTTRMKEVFLDMITLPTVSLDDDLQSLSSIMKEDLIIFDNDLGNDYPLEVIALSLNIPPGFRILEAKGIPHNSMPSLLLRAKVVLDLAMPGAERISAEGAMMGAIPIISRRWNGASDIDYPSIHKVDIYNSTEISNILANVALNYEKEIKSSKNSKFLAYILSMWRRSQHTLDIIIGSSFLHFILIAKTIEEEILLNFQILAILYLYPLASIDVYVSDVGWYIRHHYKFYSSLKIAGYIRYDRYDPHDVNNSTTSSSINHHSMIRILSIYSIFNKNNHNLSSLNQNNNVNENNYVNNNFNMNTGDNVNININVPLQDDFFYPLWNQGDSSIICILPAAIIPSNSFILLNKIQKYLEPNKILQVQLSSNDMMTSINSFPFQELSESPSILLFSKLNSTNLVSNLILKYLSKQNPFSLQSKSILNYFHVCDLLQMNSIHHNSINQRNLSFIEGITLSSPWKILKSYYHELNTLNTLNCLKK